jgi:hypothetical protein
MYAKGRRWVVSTATTPPVRDPALDATPTDWAVELVSADQISQHGYAPRESGVSGDAADGSRPAEELGPADAMNAQQGRRT